MKQPKFGPIYLAFTLFAILIIIFMFYVNTFVKKVTSVDGLATNLDLQKFQGLFIEKKALSSNNFFFILDSSNLDNTDCYYHPSNIFKGKSSGFIPYLFGFNSVSHINHVLKLAALSDSFRNRKIVFLVEPLYFLNDRRNFISLNSTFDRNFSALHAYQFIFNTKIDKNLKAEIARNLLQFNRVHWDPILTYFLNSLVNKHSNKTFDYLISPIGQVILDGLEQIDRFNAYQLIIQSNQVPRQTAAPKVSLDWHNLMIHAEKDGANACRTNAFSINDTSYNNYIKPNLNHYKNSSTKGFYVNQSELKDFYLLLRLFKELKLKPLIVILPMNGFWFDYTGLPKEVRNNDYLQIKQQIQKAGFGYVDFFTHEYDKYFLHDTKHVGWKGWVYIDREMDHFYHQ